jgi:hypothetical protein
MLDPLMHYYSPPCLRPKANSNETSQLKLYCIKAKDVYA